MKTCLLNSRKYPFSWIACRYYARKRGHNIREFISPEEDVQKLKGRVRDPKMNAYLPYNPDDPVQKSHSIAAKRTKENYLRNKINETGFKINENVTKGYRKTERVSKGNKSAPNFSGKDEHDQDSISFEKLEEADKRFGYDHIKHYIVCLFYVI
jgi:hypothetical protein